MILTDREIQLALENEQIQILPEPKPEAFSSTSLDLTLDEPGHVWKELRGQPIRPATRGYSYHQLAARKEVVSLNGFTLSPQSFVLAWTRETVTLPGSSRLAARVEGKSSLARLGLGIHITAPTIHAGFTGQIQLEMCNFGPNEIILDVGTDMPAHLRADLWNAGQGLHGTFRRADRRSLTLRPESPTSVLPG